MELEIEHTDKHHYIQTIVVTATGITDGRLSTYEREIPAIGGTIDKDQLIDNLQLFDYLPAAQFKQLYTYLASKLQPV